MGNTTMWGSVLFCLAVLTVPCVFASLLCAEEEARRCVESLRNTCVFHSVNYTDSIKYCMDKNFNRCDDIVLQVEVWNEHFDRCNTTFWESCGEDYCVEKCGFVSEAAFRECMRCIYDPKNDTEVCCPQHVHTMVFDPEQNETVISNNTKPGAYDHCGPREDLLPQLHECLGELPRLEKEGRTSEVCSQFPETYSCLMSWEKRYRWTNRQNFLNLINMEIGMRTDTCARLLLPGNYSCEPNEYRICTKKVTDAFASNTTTGFCGNVHVSLRCMDDWRTACSEGDGTQDLFYMPYTRLKFLEHILCNEPEYEGLWYRLSECLGEITGLVEEGRTPEACSHFGEAYSCLTRLKEDRFCCHVYHRLTNVINMEIGTLTNLCTENLAIGNYSCDVNEYELCTEEVNEVFMNTAATEFCGNVRISLRCMDRWATSCIGEGEIHNSFQLEYNRWKNFDAHLCLYLRDSEQLGYYFECLGEMPRLVEEGRTAEACSQFKETYSCLTGLAEYHGFRWDFVKMEIDRTTNLCIDYVKVDNCTSALCEWACASTRREFCMDLCNEEPWSHDCLVRSMGDCDNLAVDEVLKQAKDCRSAGETTGPTAPYLCLFIAAAILLVTT